MIWSYWILGYLHLFFHIPSDVSGVAQEMRSHDNTQRQRYMIALTSLMSLFSVPYDVSDDGQSSSGASVGMLTRSQRNTQRRERYIHHQN